ncbi:MAG: SRPBCC family protein [Gemmataceae bacterium]|nr:SRPBCC family protein [Gemmataceae bacterium]
MGWLGWMLTITGLLIGLVSLMTIVGVFIPRDHVATRSLTLSCPPADVYELWRKTDEWPTWWKLVKSVENLPDPEGRKAVRLTYVDKNCFDLIVEEAPPHRMVTRIDDRNKMFEGTWTYEVEPTPTGCVVRLTERGTIPNPLIRTMARLMMNPAMYIEIHLKALAERCGSPANIQP